MGLHTKGDPGNGQAVFAGEHISQPTYHLVDDYARECIEMLPAGWSGTLQRDRQARSFELTASGPAGNDGQIFDWCGGCMSGARRAGLRWGAGGSG